MFAVFVLALVVVVLADQLQPVFIGKVFKLITWIAELLYAVAGVLGSCVFLLLILLSTNYGFVQMMTNSPGAKRENAGTKKSPQQIQMLEKFYSGNYMLVFGNLFLRLCYTFHCCWYLFLSRCAISKARGNGAVCNLCWFDLQSGSYMVQRAEEEREEEYGSHWVLHGKAT